MTSLVRLVSVSAPDGLKVQQQRTSQRNFEDKRAKESRSQKHNRVSDAQITGSVIHFQPYNMVIHDAQ